MSTFYQRGAEKRRNWQEMRLRDQEVGNPVPAVARPGSPKPPEMEQEKRMRREIANSNERRRMQSINAGFQSLKSMIPHQDGEKLSKAAILQHTTDFIFRLQRDRTHLISENNELKQMLRELGHGQSNNSPPPKRKKRDTESSCDEGISMSVDTDDHHTHNTTDEYKRELVDLRTQLEQERKQRMALEKRLFEQDGDCEDAFDNHKKEKSTDCQKWVKEEPVEAEPTPIPRPAPVASPSQTTSTVPPPTNQDHLSLSSRNLHTIVEAIRHLEGDDVLLESGMARVERSLESACDESGTESSYDLEDTVSEGSTSPASTHMECESSTPPTAYTASTLVHMATPPMLLHHHGLHLASPGATTADIECTPYVTSPPYPLPLQLLTQATDLSSSRQHKS